MYNDNIKTLWVCLRARKDIAMTIAESLIEKIVEGLSKEKKEAVISPARYLRIVASAGAGKTETITRKIVYLIATGVEPGSIIAFTFTERAAQEMKERIYRRVEEFLEADMTKNLGDMYIGTILGLPCRYYRMSLDMATTTYLMKTKRWRSYYATAGASD